MKIPFWKTNYLMLRLFTIEAFELIALAYNSFVSPRRLFGAGSCVHANCNPLFLAVAALTHRGCVYGNTSASNESKWKHNESKTDCASDLRHGNGFVRESNAIVIESIGRKFVAFGEFLVVKEMRSVQSYIVIVIFLSVWYIFHLCFCRCTWTIN